MLEDRALELFVVADGMGGHPDGDADSQFVVDSVRPFVLETVDREKTWPFEFDLELSYTANRLKGALLFANSRLAEHIVAGGPKGMGATVAAALFSGGRAVVANVGDCRGYVIDRHGLRQLTRDHSWVAEQVGAGFITPEAARAHPWRHMVTRAVQGEPGLLVDTIEFDSTLEGRLLLCSDGLHVAVSDQQIASIIGVPASSVEASCEALIEAACDAGAPDNVSVIVTAVPAASGAH